jgi:hypothetical protein
LPRAADFLAVARFGAVAFFTAGRFFRAAVALPLAAAVFRWAVDFAPGAVFLRAPAGDPASALVVVLAAIACPPSHHFPSIKPQATLSTPGVTLIPLINCAICCQADFLNHRVTGLDSRNENAGAKAGVFA